MELEEGLFGYAVAGAVEVAQGDDEIWSVGTVNACRDGGYESLAGLVEEAAAGGGGAPNGER